VKGQTYPTTDPKPESPPDDTWTECWACECGWDPGPRPLDDVCPECGEHQGWSLQPEPGQGALFGDDEP